MVGQPSAPRLKLSFHLKSRIPTILLRIARSQSPYFKSSGPSNMMRPGETQTLKFPVGKDELSFWSPQTRVWGVEPGTFDVWAGEDSTASLHTELVVTE